MSAGKCFRCYEYQREVTLCPLHAAAPKMLALLEEYAAKAKDVTNPAPGSLIERTRAILRETEGQRPDVEGESNG